MKQTEHPHWPLGEGRIATLIRARDWSATGLGPIASWPLRLKITVDNLLRSPAPMALYWGADGISIYNDAYAAFVGTMHPALLGSKMVEAWPWDRKFAAHVLQVGLGGGSLSCRDEQFTLHRNGKAEQAWLHLDFSPVPDDSGRPAGILAVVVDNTEKVRAEKTLRDSEENFRLALKYSPMVVFTQDKALRYIWAFNPKLGYSVQDVLGKTDETLLSTEVASPLTELKRRVLDSGSGAREEVRVSRNGQDHFYDLTIEPLRDANGDITGIACAAMDVTQRREAEQARQTAEKALARMTRQLTDAQRLAHIGSWDWDLETDTIVWSDEHFRIFGLDPATYRPAYHTNMQYIHPDDRQKGWDAVNAAMAGRECLNVELRLVCADGAERQVISRGEVTFDAAGRPVRMVGTIQDITERKIAEDALRDISVAKARVHELERRGNEDALTGLPNRYWVETFLPQAIQRASAKNAMLALLFVDLDGFKAVNDALGHPAGDELLRLAARRLKVAVRPEDQVARLGGDEFVIILENVAHKRDAAHVAERVVQAFQESFTLPQGVQSVGASIGISLFPLDGRDTDTLLRNADIAMYSVKAGGKRSYHFFDSKFCDSLRNRLQQETELRNAVLRDQFIMYYQPRLEVSTGAISGMEALVRWAHPSRGLVEPPGFIPLAEESGLIVDLGQLIIEKVCVQLARWASGGRKLLPVSINVSPRQFNHANIVDILSASLLRHHIDPALVGIELKEASIMEDAANAPGKLAAIRGMGVKLLLDDFGTGYSSLAQLQWLEFDVLKVDRGFTRAMATTEKTKKLYKAIITMAHALGMRVVAEGVEEERQSDILKSLCWDELQGFHVARPMPPAE